LNFSAKQKKKKKKKESASLLYLCFLQKLTRTLSPFLLLSCSASIERERKSSLKTILSSLWVFSQLEGKEMKSKITFFSLSHSRVSSKWKEKEKRKKEKDPLSSVSLGRTYLRVFGVLLNISS
jgi:hypothetical protein